MTPPETLPGAEEIPSKETFQMNLLHTVSERTGYPIEMLGLDLNLERDLGIDSIRLVEIVSSLRRYRDLLQIKDEEKFIDTFTSLKTLRGIVEWYERNRLQVIKEHPLPTKKHTHADQAQSPPSPTPGASDLDRDPVQRFVLTSVLLPLNEPSAVREFPKDCVILLVGEAQGLSAVLCKEFTSQGYRFCHLIPGKKTRRLHNNCFEVDLSSLESAQELRTLIAQTGEAVGGIFNLMGMTNAPSPHSTDHESMDDAIRLFLLVKVFEPDLRERVRNGGGLLINFSSMDGQFGLQGRHSFPIGQAGCVGLCKTIMREWPEVRVKCVDINLTAEVHLLSTKIWQEIISRNGLIEVGLNQEGQWRIDLQEEVAGDESPSPLPLDSQSVILVTGGAYGITAEVAKTLAAHYQPHLIIVGRTPCPPEEPSPTKELRDPQTLRTYLIQELTHKDPKVTPATVEKCVQEILKQRMIHSNLKTMTDSGARVEYHSLDLRDTKLFARLLDDLYARWGKIDGVIHGAGIIEDKLIKDKTPEQFSRVFTTKVAPAKVLAEKLRPETLKFLVFFSSVVGRFGNSGQSDYSASNEVLNKLAVRLNHAWPARVVSINWGPWDSGMISEELRQLYAARGIKLIPVAEGIRFFMEELARGHGAPEVIITRSLTQIAHSSPRSMIV